MNGRHASTADVSASRRQMVLSVLCNPLQDDRTVALPGVGLCGMGYGIRSRRPVHDARFC